MNANLRGRPNRPAFHFFMTGALVLLLALAGSCGPDADARQNRSQQLEVEVRLGERMRDFCARLERRRVSTCRAFREVAARLPLTEYRFVPPRADRLNRFEGVFRPGAYRVPLQPADWQSTLPDSSCAAEYVEGQPRYSAVCPLDRPERMHPFHLRIARRIVEYLAGQVGARYDAPGGAGGLNAREQMVLASIVEKEAVSNRDYDRVAAVFHNRLRRKMALGSCPTVEYALGFHRPFLLFKDLEIDSPYNVYKKPGLPPTPIAFFSDGALAAARTPAAEDILFFVYDWTTGNLHFATDYSDHKRYARTARENFKREFGKAVMYRKFPDKFYEPIR